MPRLDAEIEQGHRASHDGASRSLDGPLLGGRYRVEERELPGRPNCRHGIEERETNKKVFIRWCVDGRQEFEDAIRIHNELKGTDCVCKYGNWNKKWQPPLLSVARMIEHFTTTDGYPYIVYERGDSTLEEELAAPRISSFRKQELLQGVLRAVKSLHQQNKVHGRLCPANVMWFADGFTWKLVHMEHAPLLNDRPAVRLGGGRYASPEITDRAREQGNQEATVGTTVDMWAVGLIAFEIITGSTVLDPAGVRAFVNAKLADGSSSAASSAEEGNASQERKIYQFVQGLLRDAPRQRMPAFADLCNYILNDDASHDPTTAGTSPTEPPVWERRLNHIFNDCLGITVRSWGVKAGVDTRHLFHCIPSKQCPSFCIPSFSPLPIQILRNEGRYMLCIRISATQPFGELEDIISASLFASSDELEPWPTQPRTVGGALEIRALLDASQLLAVPYNLSGEAPTGKVMSLKKMLLRVTAKLPESGGANQTRDYSIFLKKSHLLPYIFSGMTASFRIALESSSQCLRIPRFRGTRRSAARQ